MTFRGKIITQEEWENLIPLKPEPSEAAKRAAQEQFERESDADYSRRLYREQN